MASARPTPRRWRASLHLRLLVGTLIWIAVTIAAAGWGLSRVFGEQVRNQFDAALQIHLNQLAANLVVSENGNLSLPLPLSDPRFSRPYSGLYWQVDQLDAAGRYDKGALRSRSLWDAALNVPAATPDDGEVHTHHPATGPDHEALYLIERTLHPGGPSASTVRLIVAGNESLLREPIHHFQGLLTAALVLLASGLAAAAVVQVVVGLRPLGKLRKALSAVREGRETALSGHFPSEIQPLVDEFNAVLSRNAEVVERARTQAGNLAHAVKTPLAVLANAADREDGEFARLVEEQVQTAKTQVDRHLARARAAAAAQIPGQFVSLDSALQGLIRVLSRVYAERNLTFSIDEAAQDLVFYGDAQDLQEMLGNLLDNACKWAKQRVTVQAVAESGRLAVTIDDDGPGLSPEKREAVFARGARVDENTPGSGLGLAIVRDLAALYGGAVVLETAPENGLRARLLLPGGTRHDKRC